MQLLNKSNISINEKKDGGWPMKPGTVIGRTLHHTESPSDIGIGQQKKIICHQTKIFLKMTITNYSFKFFIFHFFCTELCSILV